MSYDSYWPPYVPVWQRRRNAEREMEKLRKKGHPVSPVVIEGRTIAKTFWGKAWCENLERYSDFENRIPRGRTYVRNGSVVDLQLSPGEAAARVAGSSLYTVKVRVAPVKPAHWRAICKDCTGGIDSLVELLQGRFSKGVMERVCQPGEGLFPTPKEIEFDCSCPDWASMCKHVAAVLYGIGARLDEKPELLFHLRKVDETELIAAAGENVPLATKAPASDRVLEGAEVAEIFGLEMAQAAQPPAIVPEATRAAPRRVRRPRPPAPRSRPKRKARDLDVAVGREVEAALKPLTNALDGVAALLGDGRRGHKRVTRSFKPGQLVRFRQGRGTLTAKIVSVERQTNALVLERVVDGRRVVRQASKVTAE